MSGVGRAGFPAGMKWKFLDRKSGKPIYLICNADESEPGTFKDRQIIYKDPHTYRGHDDCSVCNSAKQAFIYIRAEFFEGARILRMQSLKRNPKIFAEKIFWVLNFPAI